MASSNKSILVYIAMSVVALIIGFSFIYVKIALDYANPYDVLAHRFSVAMLVLFLLVITKIVQLPKIQFKSIGVLILLSLFYPILFFLLLTVGMVSTSASEAGIIFAMTPVLTLIFAALFLNERTSLFQKAGVLISVTAVMYIFYKNGVNTTTNSLIGNLLLILSVLSAIGYFILIKKLSSSYTPLDLTIIIVFVAFLVFNGIAIFRHTQTHSLNSFFQPLSNNQFLIATLYLGILSTLLTSFLTNYSLSAIPASSVSIFNNLSPIFAIFGGVVVLGDQLFDYQLYGGAFVFLGMIATLFFKNKPTLQQVNIGNLVSLWQVAAKAIKKPNGLQYLWVKNSEWPNRIWTSKALSPALLKEVINIIKANTISLTFSHFELEKQNDLGLPKQYGLIEKSKQYGMSLALHKRFDYDVRLVFKQVESEEDAQLWSTLFYESFNYIISPKVIFETRLTITYFIALFDGEPTGTLAYYQTKDIAGIHSLGIKPAMRKRGFAKEITYYVLNHAINSKARLATLQASESAKPLYEAVGFTTQFIMRNYRLEES